MANYDTESYIQKLNQAASYIKEHLGKSLPPAHVSWGLFVNHGVVTLSVSSTWNGDCIRGQEPAVMLAQLLGRTSDEDKPKTSPQYLAGYQDAIAHAVNAVLFKLQCLNRNCEGCSRCEHACDVADAVRELGVTG